MPYMGITYDKQYTFSVIQKYIDQEKLATLMCVQKSDLRESYTVVKSFSL